MDWGIFIGQTEIKNFNKFYKKYIKNIIQNTQWYIICIGFGDKILIKYKKKNTKWKAKILKNK